MAKKTKRRGKKPTGASAVRGRPVAEKLIKKMKRVAGGKVIDLGAVMAGRAHAEELQKTVAKSDALSGFHPAHAPYVITQNQVSVMAEQLTALDGD